MLRKYIIFLILVFSVLLYGLINNARLSPFSADEDSFMVSFLGHYAVIIDADKNTPGDLVDNDEEDQILCYCSSHQPNALYQLGFKTYFQTRTARFTSKTLFAELDLPPPAFLIS